MREVDKLRNSDYYNIIINRKYKTSVSIENKAQQMLFDVLNYSSESELNTLFITFESFYEKEFIG